MADEEREYSDKDAKLVEKQTNEILGRFQKSIHYSKMFKYCQKEAENVVWTLGRFAYDYDLLFPKEWTISTFTSQTYNIQRKCMYPDSFFKAFPKVIYSFSKFCESEKIGEFNKEKIDEFKEDLKDGIYEDEFHSSWDDGYKTRKKQYDAYF